MVSISFVSSGISKSPEVLSNASSHPGISPRLSSRSNDGFDVFDSLGPTNISSDLDGSVISSIEQAVLGECSNMLLLIIGINLDFSE